MRKLKSIISSQVLLHSTHTLETVRGRTLMFKGRAQPAGDSSPTQPRTLEEEDTSNRCKEEELSLPCAQGPPLPHPFQFLQLVSHASFPRQAVYPPPSPGQTPCLFRGPPPDLSAVYAPALIDCICSPPCTYTPHKSQLHHTRCRQGVGYLKYSSGYSKVKDRVPEQWVSMGIFMLDLHPGLRTGRRSMEDKGQPA